MLMEFLQKVDKDFTPRLSQKTDLSSFCDKLLANARLFVSYSDDGRIKGLVAIYANDFTRRYAYVPLVAVSPECRSQGVAKALVYMAVAYVKDLGRDNIQTVGIHTSNPIALALYRKLGFRMVSENGNREYLELHL